MFSRTKKDKTTQPSKPISFGYKTGWFAFKCPAERVLDRLCSAHWGIEWQSAIDDFLLKNKPFVAPTPGEWTLLSTDSDQIVEDLTKLTTLLDCDVAYFASHRVVSYFAYGWTVNGTIERVHAQADFEILEDMGELSEIEEELGLDPFVVLDPVDEEEVCQRHEDELHDQIPDESSVLQIAAAIAFNPDTFDEQEPSLPFGVKLAKW